jgi:PAS domain S-box-containing protein
MALNIPPAQQACAAAQATLDALPDAVAVVEASGAIVHANRRLRAAVPEQDGDPPPWPQLLVERFGAPAGDIAPLAQAARELLDAGAGADAGVDLAAAKPLRWRASESPPRWLEASLIALAEQPGQGLLQLRDVTIEQELAASQTRLRAQLDETMERLRCFAAITSETLVISERGKILFVNEAAQRMFGLTQEEAIGRSVLEFAAPEFHQEIIRHLSTSNDDTPYETVCVHRDGRRFMAEVRGRLLSYHDRPVRGAALLDVTQRKKAEAALRERLLAEERVRAQIETLAALSTPLIPVREDVLVLPLVGDLDVTRLARVTETLLGGISERRARCAILDITGVPKLDGAAAEALVRAAQGGRLLGALILLSGVRAEVAHMLVAIGADLSGLKTYRSLQSAIAAAFAAFPSKA